MGNLEELLGVEFRPVWEWETPGVTVLRTAHIFVGFTFKDPTKSSHGKKPRKTFVLLTGLGEKLIILN